MVVISELEQDLTITGREVVIADDGEFGTTKQIVLTEVSVAPAASLALLIANYIKEVGIKEIKFVDDGTSQTTAAANIFVSSVPVGGKFYMIGDSSTDGSVRMYVEENSLVRELRVSGNWEEIGRDIPSIVEEA